MKYQILARIREMSTEALAEIALQMAVRHPTEFEKLVLGDKSTSTFEVPFTGQKVSFTDAQMKHLRTFGRDQKVTCIKDIRSMTGIGLKEAKDLCEQEFVQ